MKTQTEKRKHTPGPWKAKNMPTPEGYERWEVQGPKGETLSRQSDASLIAAAPELLEACKRALTHVCGSSSLDRAVWQQLNKAITNAEGK